MKNQHITCSAAGRFEPYLRAFAQTTLAAVVVLPSLAMAEVGDATGITCGFLGSVQGLLNAVSIVVVTIAIIFAGYQIAFAHKRISDVAPVMIGAILIGAATQIAKMFLPNGDASCGAGPAASIAPDALNHMVAATQWLLQHA